MSWLDNFEQYIWDLAWDTWLSSGTGLTRSSQNYDGTEQDDIIIFYFFPNNL